MGRGADHSGKSRAPLRQVWASLSIAERIAAILLLSVTVAWTGALLVLLNAAIGRLGFWIITNF